MPERSWQPTLRMLGTMTLVLVVFYGLLGLLVWIYA